MSLDSIPTPSSLRCLRTPQHCAYATKHGHNKTHTFSIPFHAPTHNSVCACALYTGLMMVPKTEMTYLPGYTNHYPAKNVGWILLCDSAIFAVGTHRM